MEKIVQGTVQNSTSGTSIDFTGIPSWAKKITVMFNGVSTNGTSVVQIQLGSGSIQTTGYISVGTLTTGFGTPSSAVTASDNRYGNFILSSMGSNIWTISGGCVLNGTTYGGVGGGVTLSGTLDRIRITTVNGTDTFDAGQINILVEG